MKAGSQAAFQWLHWYLLLLLLAPVSLLRGSESPLHSAAPVVAEIELLDFVTAMNKISRYEHNIFSNVQDINIAGSAPLS